MRARVVALAGALTAAGCVAYDTAGPPVPSIDGTYSIVIAVGYSNYIELLDDTLLASFTLRATGYRGRFEGTYRTALGDSGLVGGRERPESTLVVDVFGAPPKPIAYVIGLRQLFPWCDFARLGPGLLSGRLRGDSLLIDGQASVPCFYQLEGQAPAVGTELVLHIVGVR